MSDDDLVNALFGGSEVTGDDPSLRAWWSAFDQLVGFHGDPIATLDAVNAVDDRFVLGSVFTLTFRLLGGVRPDDPAVVADLRRVRDRAARVSGHERVHARAALLMHDGEFLAAAQTWGELTIDAPHDLAAHRFLHDVCLHIGDDSVRLPAAFRAVEAFAAGTRAHGLAQGMLAFALGEVGRLDEAERAGRSALAIDPDDLWARHALAHVYETTARHAETMHLLIESGDGWHDRTLLSNHVWWHVGVRLLHQGELDGALDVFDRRLTSTTAFGLCDATSLLWRLGLARSGDGGGSSGGSGPGEDDLGRRWRRLADRWAVNEQRHTCGFLDLHAALAFAAVGAHDGAERFWAGVAAAHEGDDSYNGQTFRTTVRPLVEGLRAVGRPDRITGSDAAAARLRAVLPTLRRIGGSEVQRDLVRRTLEALG